MGNKIKCRLIAGASLLVVFILFTVSLKYVDVQPIGPQGSCVAYAGLNKAVHELFGVNMVLYTITDWAGVVAICIALGFAILGAVQWFERKSILKVDSTILILGIFYLLVFGTYVFFEFHVIGHRPVLIDGILEASYPSSTTMLAMCILPTAMIQLHRRIGHRAIRYAVELSCGLFMAFMVIGRLVCGVHWCTDILGGSVYSIAMVLLYHAADQWASMKEGWPDGEPDLR